MEPEVAPAANGIQAGNEPAFSIAGVLRIGCCFRFMAGSFREPVALHNGTMNQIGKQKAGFQMAYRRIRWYAFSIPRITKKRYGSIPDSA